MISFDNFIFLQSVLFELQHGWFLCYNHFFVVAFYFDHWTLHNDILIIVSKYIFIGLQMAGFCVTIMILFVSNLSFKPSPLLHLKDLSLNLAALPIQTLHELLLCIEWSSKMEVKWRWYNGHNSESVMEMNDIFKTQHTPQLKLLHVLMQYILH